MTKNEIEKDKKTINHPQRYGGDSQYECVKVLKAWMGTEEHKGFLKGNCLKYLCREGKKDSSIQDLEKAKWYLEKLIELEKENER